MHFQHITDTVVGRGFSRVILSQVAKDLVPRLIALSRKASQGIIAFNDLLHMLNGLVDIVAPLCR